MLASALSAHRRSVTLLAAVAVAVLPGGSLIVGAYWLYRHFYGR